MSQSEWLAAVLIAGFLVWLAMSKRLAVYWSILTGGGAQAAPATDAPMKPQGNPLTNPPATDPATGLPLPVPTPRDPATGKPIQVAPPAPNIDPNTGLIIGGAAPPAGSNTFDAIKKMLCVFGGTACQ
jgi:hypothetical protein